MKNQLREPDFNLKAFVQQLTPPSKSADTGKGGRANGTHLSNSDLEHSAFTLTHWSHCLELGMQNHGIRDSAALRLCVRQIQRMGDFRNTDSYPLAVRLK
jgi:hypothetical protein